MNDPDPVIEPDPVIDPGAPDPTPPGGGDRRFRVGEEILLIDRKKRRYLVALEEGAEFHTHSGFVPHAAIVGKDGLAPTSAALEAGKVVALANKEAMVMGPTPSGTGVI